MDVFAIILSALPRCWVYIEFIRSTLLFGESLTEKRGGMLLR